jgi:hypothetical protein
MMTKPSKKFLAVIYGMYYAPFWWRIVITCIGWPVKTYVHVKIGEHNIKYMIDTYNTITND